MDTYDTIVIGSGLSGLIASRNIAKKHFKTLLLEANSNIGGRSKSLKVSTFDDHGIDLGPHEWFCEEYHKELLYEIKNYNLPYFSGGLNENDKIIWSFGDKTSGSLVSGIIPLQEEHMKLYNDCMAKLLKDLYRVSFSQGYNPGDEEDLDQSFEDYVISNLKATGLVQELFLSRATVLMGALPKDFSVIAVLRNLVGFYNPKNFFLQSFSRLKNGIGELIDCIAKEYISYNGKILCNQPVVKLMHIPPSPGFRSKCIEVTTYDGSKFYGNSVILATPMQTLGSITFNPLLPYPINNVINACNIHRNEKYWIIASGITKDFDRIITGDHCLESIVRLRLKPVEERNVNDTKNEINDRETGSNNEFNKIRAVMDFDTFLSQRNHVFLGQPPSCFTIASSPYHIISPTNPLAHTFSSYNEDISSKKAATPRVSTSTALLSIRITSESMKAMNLPNMLEFIRNHHPTVRDIHTIFGLAYRYDPFSRGGQFVPRVGISRLYHLACEKTKQPWIDINEYFTIAGSDWNDTSWLGWMEASVTSGNDASKYILKKLAPKDNRTILKIGKK